MTVLETLAQRDRRIRREKRNRRLWKAAGYLFAVFFGVLLAGPAALMHGFNRGVDHEKQRVADLPKVAHPTPAPLTQWKCNEQEFREHAEACVRRGDAVPSWYRHIKPKG